MGGILLTIRSWWERADRNQRAVTAGGAGLLLLLMAGTFLFASRPHFSPLLTNLTLTDKGVIQQELESMGVDAHYDVDGEIDVPYDKKTQIMLHLSQANKLPKNAHIGIENLDKMTLMQTPAQERARLQSILEGELAKTIEQLEGVQAANVKITQGDDSPFSSLKKPATAGVTITESASGHLGVAEGRAIATLVKSCVDGLEMPNITVINQRMELLYDGQNQNAARSAVSERSAAELAESERRKGELQMALDRVFGTGSTVVTVHTELDLDTQKSHSIVQNPKDSLATTKITESMINGSGKPAGVGGMIGNQGGTPASKDAGSANGGKYVSSNSTDQKAVDQTETDIQKMPGTIKSLVINVIADSSKITDTKQAALQKIIDGEVKNHALEAQAYPTSVTFVAFDTTSATDTAKAAAAAASAARMQQIISLLPIGALLIIALMVMKQVSKFAKSQTAHITTQDGQTFTMSIDGIPGHTAPVSAATLLAAIEGTSHEGMIGPDGKHISSLEPPIDVEDIKDKVHMPLEQLKKMAHERPQVVAMLIKSLLLEDRR